MGCSIRKLDEITSYNPYGSCVSCHPNVSRRGELRWACDRMNPGL
jgi:hypothetical protein